MITNVDNIEQLTDTAGPVVVCFTNPYTCNPCRVFKPHFENAANTVKGATFLEVDATDPANADIVQEYLTKFLTPTVIFIKDGERTEVEARTTIPLIDEINELL